MRLIRLTPRAASRRGPLAMAALMLLVGAVAAVLATVAPSRRAEASAALAVAAALGLGVGGGTLGRTLRSRSDGGGKDLVGLLAPSLDDSYLLLLHPRLPGVPRDLEALLVGPPGVRALVVRRWHGRYRVRHNGWEFDAHGAKGWIRCITNPSFESGAASNAVAGWARGAVNGGTLPIAPAVAFPARQSRLILEEPDVEVITTENVPWWANRIGRVQRMDAAEVVAFVEAVVQTSRLAANGG
ncbi:MAG TPA: hypothetical protein VKU35_02075 [Candidatus Limnocylindria bacterium]|nr:hypothetical protein [Candidatus Limnocylindria bacterium]